MGGCCDNGGGGGAKSGGSGGGCCGGPPPPLDKKSSTTTTTTNLDDEAVVLGVKEYYGQTLKSSDSLKTSACTSCDRPTGRVAEALKLVPHEVLSKFYGCGYPIPPGVNGLRILDLGCGSGRDCYVAAALVGEAGEVVGVDMTDEQLAVARAHADEYCASVLGYARTNMRFVEGYIENLSGIGIGEQTVDLVISNCVVNLSVNKERVFAELFRALAPGGEFQFSDVFCDRELPQEVRTHKILVGECLGGAMEEEAFLAMATETGFLEPIMVTRSPIEVHDAELRDLLGDAKFSSVTYRVFKVAEDRRIKDGRVVTYNGKFEDGKSGYRVSADVTLLEGQKTRVEGKVATAVCETWISKFFDVERPCCSGGCC